MDDCDKLCIHAGHLIDDIDAAAAATCVSVVINGVAARPLPRIARWSFHFMDDAFSLRFRQVEQVFPSLAKEENQETKA